MGNPYVGEIRMVGFNFAPVGWALCNGQILPISQNTVLFQLIGTTYGGDGVSTFALPNIQSRMVVHQGTGFVIGQQAGAETVTLTVDTIPAHTHPAGAVTGHGTQAGPVGASWASASGGVNPYSTAAPDAALNAAAVASVGGGQAHDNMSPFLVISFVISLFGIFPSQS